MAAVMIVSYVIDGFGSRAQGAEKPLGMSEHIARRHAKWPGE
jgi:hypothetical protein